MKSLKNPFAYSLDNKRYHTLNYYNKKTYGKKVFKAVLECGFSCPNIDGSKGRGGCIFCDGGSGYFTAPNLTITRQLESERKRIFAKNGDNVSVIAYFQANTNTYAPIGILEKYYNEAMNFPGVVGISIGTRADCLSDGTIELLCRINEQTNLTVELGMQSMHNATISRINRCYTHEEFIEGFFRLKEKGIRTCLHIINGLPDESADMMIETAYEAARLKPEAVKLQMLHVIRGTALEKIYQRGEFDLLSKDEYIDIIVRQLEVIPPETVIERITGDGDKSKLIAPEWSADKISVLGGIDKRLAELNTWQGRLY